MVLTLRYLCKELSESVFVRDVADVSGVEVVQRCYIGAVHLLLLAVHLV